MDGRPRLPVTVKGVCVRGDGRMLGERPLEVLPGRWVDVVAFACELLPTAPGDALVSDEHTAVAFLDVATLSREALPEVYRELIAALDR